MSETILEINKLNKSFGKVHAVNDLSLEIKRGQVFGILGPNGSGKTTTLGIILGVTTPDSGSFKWFGEEPSQISRRKIGAILEHPNFLPYLSARENLKIICQIRGVDYSDIDRVLKIADLKQREKSLFRTFSYGMKQRLAIAAAMLGDPGVLILDEPTNGLDPSGIVQVRQIIHDIAATNKTIIVASHLLDEVQKICSHVMIIHNGKKIHSSAVDDIIGSGHKVEIEVNELINIENYINDKSIIAGVSRDNNRLICTLAEGKTSEDLNRYFFSKGVVLQRINVIQQSLEQHFLALLKDD